MKIEDIQNLDQKQATGYLENIRRQLNDGEVSVMHTLEMCDGGHTILLITSDDCTEEALAKLHLVRLGSSKTSALNGEPYKIIIRRDGIERVKITQHLRCSESTLVPVFAKVGRLSFINIHLS